ncbi:MAG: hypothetical protein AVDCRST_MAG13-1553 [uncultured Solirubrobacteraceae bacterium]|uniref:Uncharacterized protein n=1 Tax=uncultured Solirubrobacteraceae bacterium TaxID=1162706 RepID=A0A6J4S1Y0_9ACTN|nr:MAG: hypothetical protein AVDCRST_MAG13-1553 [uncultured Solirubrobacteraceae bacterium]
MLDLGRAASAGSGELLHEVTGGAQDVLLPAPAHVVAARADGRLPVLAVTDERVVLGLGDRAVLDLGHEDVVHELALAPARPADGHVEHHERGNSRRDDDQDTEVPEGPVRGAGVRPARARQGRCWLPWSTFKSFRIPVPRPSLRERRRSANFCSHELAPRRVPR